MNRRSFVKSATGLYLSSFAMPELAKADESPDRKFVVLIQIGGGWDVTLGLDPWTATERPDPSDMFIEYRDDEVLRLDGGIALGPSATPLQRHAQDISVVNGVFLSQVDNGHGAAAIYMNSGSGNGSVSSFPMEIANFGDVGPLGVFYDRYITKASRSTIATSLDELRQLPNSEDPSDILALIYKNINSKSAMGNAIRAMLASRDTTRLLKAKIEALSNQYQSIPKEELLLAGLEAGACHQGAIMIDESLDTHANHVGQHKTAQLRAWQKVANIFDKFKQREFRAGQSMFDNTLFVVVSEFARTASLNGARGKDHNPMTNSVLFAGAGFRKKQSVGASKLIPASQSRQGTSYHIANPINYRTGQVERQRTEESRMIFPENIIKTASRIALPDQTNYSVLPEGVELLNQLLL
ncbi:MAG: hypothetical protein CL677_03355 [Bdellovibrionaceae bacterium]|nr:hypothetical protein [Pseudobdellovibrionaceae bacterium]